MDLKGEFRARVPLIEEEIGKYINADMTPTELYAPLADLMARGGKRVRPAICMIACEAVGGDQKKAIKTSAAIEMIHNFTLVHDDIVDGSDMRRGKKCLHHIYGLDLTINAGDGLFSRSYELLYHNFEVLKPEKSLEIFGLLSTSVTRICEGQAMDISWSKNRRWDITKEDYFEMLKRKTGILISTSCECGAIIGDASGEQREALKAFGMDIGKAFQIQDDVLNLQGDEEDYGKEIGGDINEGKRTIIVIDTLEKCSPEEKRQLIGILDKESNSPNEIKEALDILKRYGAIERASKMAEELVAKAKKRLDSIPDNHGKEILLALADYFIQRKK
jgi:geranylgeranyl pyrophosphate synthase